jgi:hypothetical protein
LTKAITAGIDFALGGADRLLQHRGKLAARTAPGRPEIDQHRLPLRFLDDVLHEALGGGFLDQIGHRLRRRSAALLNYGHGESLSDVLGSDLELDALGLTAS